MPSQGDAFLRYQQARFMRPDAARFIRNLVMIPRLKHYQITGWYASRTEEFDGLSPREYLSSKDWDERRRVGLYALTKFGVLKS